MNKSNSNDGADTYLSRQEAAKYLKICLSSVDKLINRNDFDGKTKIGRRIIISKQRLDRYIKKDM